MTLRPYQEKVIEAVLDNLAAGGHGPIVQAATGSGKTTMLAEVAKARLAEGRVLVLAHRDQIIYQCADKLREVCGCAVGIEMAGRRSRGEDIVVASVPTVGRTDERRLNHVGEVGTIVVDECLIAGTMIGDSRIEDIRVGDMVPSFDPSTGDLVTRPVVRVFKRRYAGVLVRLEIGDRVLYGTPNHPIRTHRGWRSLCEIAEGGPGPTGEMISTATANHTGWGRPSAVGMHKQINGSYCDIPDFDGYVYNLEVEGIHTYVANGIVCHNCHHHAATSSTYNEVAKHYKHVAADLTRIDEGPPWVGFTATIRRTDGTTLAGIFDVVVADVPLTGLVADGYLVPVRGERILTEESIDKARHADGDFAAADLDRLTNTARRNALAVQHYCARHRDRQFIAFVSSVAHAHALAAAFKRRGVSCAAIVGNTRRELRRVMMAHYRNGSLRGLISCNVISEGVDLPMASCLLMLRPTTSQLLYTQMVGRGLRTHPGKEDCVIVDAVDICGRYSVMQLPSLIGRIAAEKKVEEAVARKAGKSVFPDIILPDMPVAEFEQIDVLGGRQLPLPGGPLEWYDVDGGWELLTPDSWKVRVSEDHAVEFDGLPHENRQCNNRLESFQHTDRIILPMYPQCTISGKPDTSAFPIPSRPVGSHNWYSHHAARSGVKVLA